LNEAHVEMAPGEHVLIVGAPGSGKTSLFRAIAGLWPWGSGRIGLPAAEQIMFMPKRPYISDGALRDVLAYPASPDGFTEQKLVSVLTRMGLLHLTRELNRVARWDKELTDFEQQGVAFARMLLHNPRWVIVDEAIGSLAPEARKTLFHILEKELATTTLVCISGPQAQDKFYTRVLHLSMNPQGQRFAVPCLPCATAPKEEEVVSANSR
jgi:putative ATP-binding cassette transporter